MKKVLIVCIVFCALCGCATTPVYQEKLDLGTKYLSEGNYEEAILAFNEVIKIDSNNIEAYRSLLEIYQETGQSESFIDLYQELKSKELLSESFNELINGKDYEKTYPHKAAYNFRGSLRTTINGFDYLVLDSLDTKTTKIYRINGTDIEEVYSEDYAIGIRQVSSSGNWLYYCTFNSIVRFNVVTLEKEVIVEDIIDCIGDDDWNTPTFYISGDKIIYSQRDVASIWTCDLNGDNQKRIIDLSGASEHWKNHNYFHNFIVCGEYILFTDYNSLYRTDSMGQNLIKLSDPDISGWGNSEDFGGNISLGIAVINDDIFYIEHGNNEDGKSSVTKIDLEGNELLNIKTEAHWIEEVISDGIICRSNDEYYFVDRFGNVEIIPSLNIPDSHYIDILFDNTEAVFYSINKYDEKGNFGRYLYYYDKETKSSIQTDITYY